MRKKKNVGEQRFCAFYKQGCKCVFNVEQGQSWTFLLRLTAKQAKEFNEGNKNVQSDAAWWESIQNARHLLDESFFHSFHSRLILSSSQIFCARFLLIWKRQTVPTVHKWCKAVFKARRLYIRKMKKRRVNTSGPHVDFTTWHRHRCVLGHST